MGHVPLIKIRYRAIENKPLAYIYECHVETLLICLFRNKLSIPSISAQEICNNGIEDDADGGIDLKDSESICNLRVPIVSTDFKTLICCPNSFTLPDFPNQGINCAGDGWGTISFGTPDLFNQCGNIGGKGQPSEIFPAVPPMPFPSGDGVGGFDSVP